MHLSTSLLTRARVILTLFAGLLSLGPTIYTLVFVYAFAANALFIVCPVNIPYILPTLTVV